MRAGPDNNCELQTGGAVMMMMIYFLTTTNMDLLCQNFEGTQPASLKALSLPV